MKDRALVQARPIFERLGQELGDILRIGIGSPQKHSPAVPLLSGCGGPRQRALEKGERIASYEDLDLDLIIKSAAGMP